MSVTTWPRRVLAGAAAAGVGLLLMGGAATPALADQVGQNGPVVPEPIQLPHVVTGKICGNFAGTIIWSNGVTLDCSSGELTVPPNVN